MACEEYPNVRLSLVVDAASAQYPKKSALGTVSVLDMDAIGMVSCIYKPRAEKVQLCFG